MFVQSRNLGEVPRTSSHLKKMNGAQEILDPWGVGHGSRDGRRCCLMRDSGFRGVLRLHLGIAPCSQEADGREERGQGGERLE